MCVLDVTSTHPRDGIKPWWPKQLAQFCTLVERFQEDCCLCRVPLQRPYLPEAIPLPLPGTFYETSSALKSPDLRSFWRSELGYLDFLHAVLCSFVLLGDRRIHVSGAFSKKTGSGLPQIPPG